MQTKDHYNFLNIRGTLCINLKPQGDQCISPIIKQERGKVHPIQMVLGDKRSIFSNLIYLKNK